MKTILLFLGLLSFTAFGGEGGSIGNGGVSVVCRDPQGNILSAELLDLYEGREIDERTYPPENFEVEKILQWATAKLDKFSNFKTILELNLVIAKNSIVYIKSGNELEPTNDAFPSIKKKDCKFEQLANYTNEGTLLISEEIFDHLDNVNKAALYVHEAIYAIRRKMGDKTSIISRRFVSNLFAIKGDQKVIGRIVSTSIGLKTGKYSYPGNSRGGYETVEDMPNNGILLSFYMKDVLYETIYFNLNQVKQIHESWSIYFHNYIYLHIINERTFVICRESNECSNLQSKEYHILE